MNIIIKSTHMPLTPAIKKYAESKVSSLEKFTKSAGEARAAVEVGVTTHHHKQGNIFRAELKLNVPGGGKFYVVSERDDLYAAIDDMKAKAERECKMLKGKKTSLAKRGKSAIKAMMKNAEA